MGKHHDQLDLDERGLARAGAREAPAPLLDAIVAGVAAAYGLAPEALGQPSRQRRRAAARIERKSADVPAFAAHLKAINNEIMQASLV
jgi:hypothetical protein